MPDMKQEEEYKKLRHQADMAREHKKEQDTDLMTPSPKQRAAARSPENSWAGAQMIPENEEAETVTPAKLFERRSTTTAQATTVPSGTTASPHIVAGHSGVDHPPGIDEIEPGVS